MKVLKNQFFDIAIITANVIFNYTRFVFFHKFGICSDYKSFQSRLFHFSTPCGVIDVLVTLKPYKSIHVFQHFQLKMQRFVGTSASGIVPRHCPFPSKALRQSSDSAEARRLFLCRLPSCGTNLRFTNYILYLRFQCFQIPNFQFFQDNYCFLLVFLIS